MHCPPRGVLVPLDRLGNLDGDMRPLLSVTAYSRCRSSCPRVDACGKVIVGAFVGLHCKLLALASCRRIIRMLS
jgi:hypothetical protein